MGYLEIVAAGIIWAATGPLVRKLLETGFTSWDIVLGRAVFSLGFMGLWLVVKANARKKRAAPGDLPPMAGEIVPEPQDIPVFMALGFLAVVLAQTTYFYALSKTSVAVAVTLNYTAPFFVMVISYLLYKEPMTGTKAAALVAAVLGVAMASGFIGSRTGRLDMNVPGSVAGLASGLSYGSQTVVYKRVGRKYGPIPLNFWTMAFGALDLAVLLTIVTRRPPEVFARVLTATPTTWWLLLLIGLGPGTAAFLLFADGINKVDATRGSIVAMSEPVAACLLGYLLLGESLTFLQVTGILLVLGSIWMVSIPGVKTDQVRMSRKRCS